MVYEKVNSLPPQQLPFNKKTKKWRMQHLDWCDNRTFFNYEPVRKSVIHKKINYDLLNGILHMNDLKDIINPENILADFVSDKILHYPIMNSKLNVLRGEESKRIFDYRVIVTNPNAVSEIENEKKKLLLLSLLLEIANTSLSEEEFNQRLEELNDYYTYQWLDIREIRANTLINHYWKEYNMPFLFNTGFMDAMAVGEEIYQCDIVGGEPVIERIDPCKIRVFKSGYSNKIEDADMIVLEDYWSPGKIIDTYYDVLTLKDREYIEKIPYNLERATNSMGNVDERYSMIDVSMMGDDFSNDDISFSPFGMTDGIDNSLLPYDMEGNIRVLRVYWKSRRKIKKVKSYDPMTGEEVFTFYPETYIIDEARGEEELIFWINEAWEGTKIGSDVYVNMRPRVVQYNRLSNPSRCHFGIIGSVYNLNNDKPYSLVDMMKSYNYLYDAVHDRLNKLLAKNWGKIVRLDLSRIPRGWTVDKWMYYARTNNIAVEDSFNEGNIGAATGKLAGALNNNTSGVIDAELGNIIQLDINLLEFIKMEMSEVAGITKQREGQVSNRETVGGVERATLLSSHITEWLFIIHDDVKKRAIEAFIETAKAAIKGGSKKFAYILSDGSEKIMEIDGDEFSENDYGIVVDNSNGTLKMDLNIDVLAQAALQNQILDFSTIMKLYGSSSIAEKQRMVELSERKMIERQQQQQQLQLQIQLEEMQAQAQLKQAELDQKELANIRDNETKILIATISAQNALEDGIQEPIYSQEAKDNLKEKMREFDAKIKLDREKLELDKKKLDADTSLKRELIKKSSMHKSN